MVTKRSSPKSEPDQLVQTDWSVAFRAALNEVGQAKRKFPDFFPNGINRIGFEFEAERAVRIKLDIEGPEGGASASPNTGRTPFELTAQPLSVLTPDSPTEGAPVDQAKLNSGKTLEGTAKVFVRKCLDKESGYLNNCAHYLSNAFINAGFSELSAPHSCVSHRCGSPNCRSGGRRWIQANDMMCWFVEKDKTSVEKVRKGTGFYAVYQQRQSDGQEHVVLLDSNAWKFYGTGWFEAGQPAPEDWKHRYFQWA